MTPEQELLEAQITINDLRARLAVAEQKAEELRTHMGETSDLTDAEATVLAVELVLYDAGDCSDGELGVRVATVINAERQRADAAEQQVQGLTDEVAQLRYFNDGLTEQTLSRYEELQVAEQRVRELTGQLDACEQHVKILQQQFAEYTERGADDEIARTKATLSDNVRLREALERAERRELELDGGLKRVRKYYAAQHHRNITADEIMDVIDGLRIAPGGICAALATPNAAPGHWIESNRWTKTTPNAAPSGGEYFDYYKVHNLPTPPRERTAEVTHTDHAAVAQAAAEVANDLARAEERERCAKLVESYADEECNGVFFRGSYQRDELAALAAAMRKEPEHD